MGGFLGIGGSSAKTDRNTQLAAQQGNWNIFNWGLPQGEATQAQGQATLNSSLKPLGQAQDYFSKLLTEGRQQTMQNAAPAVQATLDASNAQKTQAGQFGTQRVGGTAAAQREAGSAATSSIDKIINQNLLQGQQEGAQGLESVAGAKAGIGAEQLSNSLALLGLSENSINSIMNNATASRAESFKENQAVQSQWEQVIGSALDLIP